MVGRGNRERKVKRERECSRYMITLFFPNRIFFRLLLGCDFFERPVRM